MEESVKVNPLATEKIERLILKFSIPAIISMLVSSLYNIVDQIFIGQGVGLLGNAATNIAFPITIICTATALLLGIGSASNFNLSSGAGEQECACRYAGTGLAMLMLCGVTIAVIVLLFLDPLLHVFGVTKDVLPYAQDYTGITAFGIPFLILTTGESSDPCRQKPDLFYDLYAYGGNHQYDSGSTVYFWIPLGNERSCMGNCNRSDRVWVSGNCVFCTF